MSEKPGQVWLPFYLRDHLAGATAGVNLFERVADGHRDPRVRREVRRLGIEVKQDRDDLKSVMGALRIRQVSITMLAAVAAELAGRLKPNGSLVRRSVGADVLELEALLAAVHGKAQLWRTLLALTGDIPGLDGDRLRELGARADAQQIVLRSLHADVLRASPTR